MMCKWFSIKVINDSKIYLSLHNEIENKIQWNISLDVTVTYNKIENAIQRKISFDVTFTFSMRVFQDFELFIDKMLSITL